MEDREKKFINDIGQHFDASEDLLKSNQKKVLELRGMLEFFLCLVIISLVGYTVLTSFFLCDTSLVSGTGSYVQTTRNGFLKYYEKR